MEKVIKPVKRLLKKKFDAGFNFGLNSINDKILKQNNKWGVFRNQY